MIDMTPILISLKLAVFTTLILFFISLFILYFLVFVPFKNKEMAESIINLPIILPPSALWFYSCYLEDG